MQLGILLGGLVLALLVFGRTKVKNPDPLARANEASLDATAERQFARLTANFDRARSLSGAEKIVLSHEQQSRLWDAINFPGGYLGVDLLGNERGFRNEREYRNYINGFLKTPQFSTFNREKAIKLAEEVADHLRQYRGWYVIELVQDFQVACGLIDQNGQASGRYGGQTMGALAYFLFERKNARIDFDQLPSPIHDPKWIVQYSEPVRD